MTEDEVDGFYSYRRGFSRLATHTRDESLRRIQQQLLLIVKRLQPQNNFGEKHWVVH